MNSYKVFPNFTNANEFLSPKLRDRCFSKQGFGILSGECYAKNVVNGGHCHRARNVGLDSQAGSDLPE